MACLRSFFVAGLEVKRELTSASLPIGEPRHSPSSRRWPGSLCPRSWRSGGAAASGGAWAIAVPTDIAFSLGVLALVGSALPSGVRVLLLSIAVIDDLIAIAIIALVFTADLALVWLAGGLLAGGLYWLAFRASTVPGSSGL
jgi:NhaA family Na+:H+ antiporter